MTRDDHKILFKALGFLAVIVRDVPADKQAARAQALATLMENFCFSTEAESSATPPAEDRAEALQGIFTSLVNDNRANHQLVQDAMQALAVCQQDANRVS